MNAKLSIAMAKLRNNLIFKPHNGGEYIIIKQKDINAYLSNEGANFPQVVYFIMDDIAVNMKGSFIGRDNEDNYIYYIK